MDKQKLIEKLQEHGYKVVKESNIPQAIIIGRNTVDLRRKIKEYKEFISECGYCGSYGWKEVVDDGCGKSNTEFASCEGIAE